MRQDGPMGHNLKPPDPCEMSGGEERQSENFRIYVPTQPTFVHKPPGRGQGQLDAGMFRRDCRGTSRTENEENTLFETDSFTVGLVEVKTNRV